MSVALENVNRDNWKTLGEIKEELEFGPEMQLSKWVLDILDNDPATERSFDVNLMGMIFKRFPKRTELLLGVNALEKLGFSLREKVPPVDEALEYMKGRMDTHFLFLKPWMSPNGLEELVNTYAHEKLGIRDDDENPYRFRYFWPEACEEHGNTRPEFWDCEWVVITKGIVEETRDKGFPEGLKMIKKSDENANEPSLTDAVSAEFLYKVATKGGSLFPEINDQNGNRWIYTWVTEKTGGLQLALGGCSQSSGVYVQNFLNWSFDKFGVAAVRKFSKKRFLAVGDLGQARKRARII